MVDELSPLPHDASFEVEEGICEDGGKETGVADVLLTASSSSGIVELRLLMKKTILKKCFLVLECFFIFLCTG